MPNNLFLQPLRLTQLVVVAMLTFAVLGQGSATAQDLASQLSELQAKVARLEAALNKQAGGSPTATPQQSDTANVQGGSNPAAADAASSQIPPGFQLEAGYQNCLQCHRTRPSGPLPPSHLARASNASAGGDAGGAQSGSTAAGDQPTEGGGMGMGGMGKGMMGGGMGMGGMGKGMMGGDMGDGMGMGGMSGGMGGGMGGSSGGMGGGSGKPDMGSMGDAGGTNAAMSGTGSMDQLQQMQQQMQMMMQMQMMQMEVMEMQMKMMQMKQ